MGNWSHGNGCCGVNSGHKRACWHIHDVPFDGLPRRAYRKASLIPCPPVLSRSFSAICSYPLAFRLWLYGGRNRAGIEAAHPFRVLCNLIDRER